MTRIGFIGIGKMGWPLACHLHTAGHQVTVADADMRRMEQARAEGISVADLATLVETSEVVFSSLPDDAALDAVSDAVCALARPGLVFIDTSTVSIPASERVAQRCNATGVEYLRVTLSGNNHMAAAAQLTVLASGPSSLYERMLPLLQCFGPSQFYLGDDEQARMMKLVVNLMIAQTSAMLAEAVALGRKGGLDWHDMWRVIESSAVASPIIKAKAPALKQRDFTPTFTVPQMLKDLSLILEAGNALRVALPGVSLTNELMNAAAERWPGEDYAAVIKVIEHLAGLPTELPDR
jgi:3-hydroxyisobutyrate dehydrogenase